MRFSLLLCVLLLALVAAAPTCSAQLIVQPTAVQAATYQPDAAPRDAEFLNDEASQRIRRIVLNQSDNGRALAHLVQLTRRLPATTASQIYFGLSADYLKLGKYNQAGDVLKQMLNQYPGQPLASSAITRIVRLYSSSEVTNSQQKLSSPTTIKSHNDYAQHLTNEAAGKRAHPKNYYYTYAQYLANEAVQKNTAFGKLPELTFQRAVATRLGGNLKAAQGRLSNLRRQAGGGQWRTRALAEKWLSSEREDESHVPTVVCRQTREKPLLDGVLNDTLWQANVPVQFAYDQEFLYLAITYPKIAGQDYTPDARPRTYDADLSGHDHLQLRLDADRDYATCFELTVDHRGWTSDKCWLDASWNLKWFVAAGRDENTWSVEAAIPWSQLCAIAPRSGESWVVGWKRVLGASKKTDTSSDAGVNLVKFDAKMMGGSEAKTNKTVTEGQDSPDAEATSPAKNEFHLLLFQ